MDEVNGKINGITIKAKTSFLKTADIAFIFKLLSENFDLQIPRVSKLPYRPSAGSMFIVIPGHDFEAIEGMLWKKDGYNYNKRKKGNGFQEYRQILKLNDDSLTNAYISYSNIVTEEGSSVNLQRRIYWLKGDKKKRIVHYMPYIQKVKRPNSDKSDKKNRITVCINNIFDQFSQTTSKIFLPGYRIRYISPSYSSLRGGITLFLIVNQSIIKSVADQIDVFFGEKIVKGKLVNPFTVKTQIPQTSQESVLKPEIRLSNGQFIHNPKAIFEYMQDPLEALNNEIDFVFRDDSSKDQHSDVSSNRALLNQEENQLIEYHTDEFGIERFDNVFDQFNVFSDRKLGHSVLQIEKAKIIQKNVRGWISRNRYKRLKEVVIMLQKKFKNRHK